MSDEAKSVTYSSTRGDPSQNGLSFRDVVMRGLAHDRGLFVPDSYPSVTKEEVDSWRNLSYADLATEVISKFVGEDQVPRAKLADIITRSCAAFRSKEVTPLVDVGGRLVLENDSTRSRACLRVVLQASALPSFAIDLTVLILLVWPFYLKTGVVPWTHLCL